MKIDFTRDVWLRRNEMSLGENVNLGRHIISAVARRQHRLGTIENGLEVIIEISIENVIINGGWNT